MPAHQNRDKLLVHIMNAADDIGIKLDLPLTDVQTLEGTTYITATCATFPDSEDARSIMESALHVAILEGLNEHNVKITVRTPPVLKNPQPAVHRKHASTWIAEQIEGVTEWATLCAQMLSKASYERVIETYPWKEAETMRQILPVLCLRSISNVRNSKYDPAMQGNVDLILPPIDKYLPPYIKEDVYREVEAHLLRRANSLLEVYETVHDLVQDGSRSQSLHYLYWQVFAY